MEVPFFKLMVLSQIASTVPVVKLLFNFPPRQNSCIFIGDDQRKTLSVLNYDEYYKANKPNK